jgi:hypothetical protein
MSSSLLSPIHSIDRQNKERFFMTRLLTEGFEEQVLIDRPWITTTNTGFTTGRAGIGTALSLFFGSAFETTEDFSTTEIFIRVALNLNATASGYFTLKSEQGDEFYLYVNYNNRLTLSKYNPAAPNTPVQVDTGLKVLNSYTWYSVEIRYALPGTVTVKVEGVQDIAYSQGTAPHSGTHIKSLKATGPGGGNNLFLDDLAINSASGGADGSWVGDAKIIRLKPNDDVSGSIQWTRQVASGTYTKNYQVLTSAAADNNYVRSDSSGAIDWYTVEAANLSPNAQIKRAWVAAVAREETSLGDALSLGVRVGSSGTPTWKAKTLNSNWNVHKSDELTFTPSEANSLHVGIKVGS